jgi:UDP-glucose:(heptosyl)LPS alpha-1,3-glucosyltransferase
LKGGLEKYAFRIADALRQQGHTVSILTSSPSSKEENVIQICSRVKPSALQLLWFDWNSRKYLRRHSYDIVFGFDRHFSPVTYYRAGNGCHAAYLERRKSTASLIKRFSFYCNPLHLLTMLSERVLFEKHPPRAIICNSQLVKKEILKFYPATPEKRLHVVHNGVEWYDYERPFSERKKSTVPRILFIGHEWTRKGLELALEALSHIASHDFRMVVVGKERNPAHFIKIARQYGLSDKVEFHSTPQPALAFYQASDIALLPSLYDPFANATVEALAMGLYVITTASNGGSEIICEGKNGSVIDHDPEECAKKLLYAFNRIKEEGCQKEIRQSVCQYDFSNQLKKIVSLVEG